MEHLQRSYKTISKVSLSGPSVRGVNLPNSASADNMDDPYVKYIPRLISCMGSHIVTPDLELTSPYHSGSHVVIGLMVW